MYMSRIPLGTRLTAVELVCAVATVIFTITSQSHINALSIITAKLFFTAARGRCGVNRSVIHISKNVRLKKLQL